MIHVKRFSTSFVQHPHTMMWLMDCLCCHIVWASCWYGWHIIAVFSHGKMRKWLLFQMENSWNSYNNNFFFYHWEIHLRFMWNINCHLPYFFWPPMLVSKLFILPLFVTHYANLEQFRAKKLFFVIFWACIL